MKDLKASVDSILLSKKGCFDSKEAMLEFVHLIADLSILLAVEVTVLSDRVAFLEEEALKDEETLFSC